MPFQSLPPKLPEEVGLAYTNSVCEFLTHREVLQ